MSGSLQTAPAPAPGGLAAYLSLVKFSHSVFAMPFALMGAWLAARGVPAVFAIAAGVRGAIEPEPEPPEPLPPRPLEPDPPRPPLPCPPISAAAMRCWQKGRCRWRWRAWLTRSGKSVKATHLRES